MRREICGECGSPIDDGGSCDCTELLKRGWRQCAKGQKATQWCATAESVRSELYKQQQRYEALLRQATEELEELKAENARLRVEVERFRTDGASAIRWAPSSAHWSDILRELFGPDAREGIDALETRYQQERARAEQLEEALRGWTEDQHRSCPHVNLVANEEKRLADAPACAAGRLGEKP